MSIATLQRAVVASYLTPRARDAHKGVFGHVVVLGGDWGMPGAARIAAEGALRVGAGRVTVITRPEHVSIVMSARPELMCYGFESDVASVNHILQQATVLVIGPGLGRSAWSKGLFDAVMNAQKPTLMDADALHWLQQSPICFAEQPLILTPHPGEAARLLNGSVAQVQSNRVDAVRQLQQRYGGVVVLKGAQTLLMNSSGDIVRCDAGNPGMATAGMGDLLSGMIAGFMAQGLNAWQAAQTGVLIHALAGDCAAKARGERGLLVSDLFPWFSSLIN